MSRGYLLAVLGMAALQGGLVALPRPDALGVLERLRSPIWAVVLPSMIVVGTLILVAAPPMATTFVALAEVVTPPLALLALAVVARGRRLLRGLAAVMLMLALTTGVTGEADLSVIVALGCLTLGVVIIRLIPTRWVPVSVLAMCAVDVALFAAGAGVSTAGLMADASAHFHGPLFNGVRVGRITIDYPDVVLLAALGGFAARQGIQRRAVMIVVPITIAYCVALHFAHMLPATFPVAITYVVLRWGPLVSRRGDHKVPAAPRRRRASGMTGDSTRGARAVRGRPGEPALAGDWRRGSSAG